MERNERRAQRLRQLARYFQVRWEVWPEYAYTDRHVQQIGYQLELAGTDPSWGQYVSPGNKKCEIVFEALRELADGILPCSQGAFLVKIEPHANTVTYWPRHHNRPDIMLNIEILHRGHWDDPVNESQDQALNEMKLRLMELGVRRTPSLAQAA